MNRKVRARLLQEWTSNRDCFWCGQPFSYRGKHAPTVEHFIPRALGGSGGAGNCVVAHSRCNHRRGAVYPTEAEMRAFVKVKGRAGIQVLRLLGEMIERELLAKSFISSRPVASADNSISGRVS